MTTYWSYFGLLKATAIRCHAWNMLQIDQHIEDDSFTAGDVSCNPTSHRNGSVLSKNTSANSHRPQASHQGSWTWFIYQAQNFTALVTVYPKWSLTTKMPSDVPTSICSLQEQNHTGKHPVPSWAKHVHLLTLLTQVDIKGCSYVGWKMIPTGSEKSTVTISKCKGSGAVPRIPNSPQKN